MRCPWILWLVAGCRLTAPTPSARVRVEPAVRDATTVLAALPVECTGDGELCKPENAAAVAVATRLMLEFAGYSIVDSERLNPERRGGSTEESDPASSGRLSLSLRPDRRGLTDDGRMRTESTGVSWSELSAAEQIELLAPIGVQGLLRTVIQTSPHGLARQDIVTLQLDVTRLGSSRPIWEIECAVDTAGYYTLEQALDLVTRCALESQALW